MAQRGERRRRRRRRRGDACVDDVEFQRLLQRVASCTQAGDVCAAAVRRGRGSIAGSPRGRRKRFWSVVTRVVSEVVG